MTRNTKPERPDQLNVHTCVADKCDSILFYDWGLELLDRSGYNTALGPGQQPYIYRLNVKVCARCQTPQGIIDSELVDLSRLISAEEVDATIRRGKSEIAAPPKVRDP